VAGMPGGTVVVPITLDTAAGLESVEITLLYPAENLQLLDVRLGGLTQDFQYFVKDTSVPGRIVLDLARMEALRGGAGTLVELEFRIADGAQGSLAIDLQATALNETRLTLNAESQPGLDPTDGRIILPVAQAPVIQVMTVGLLASAAVPLAGGATPIASAMFDPTAIVNLLAPAVPPAPALLRFDVAAPVVQPLPQINFSQARPDFVLGGARPDANWVRAWVSGGPDKVDNLRLNGWKLAAPASRSGTR